MATILKEKDAHKSFTERIQLAAKAWTKLAEPCLKKRKKMLEYWASGYFKESGEQVHTLNLTARMIGILVPYLTMGNPRVLIETKYPQLKPFADTTELQMNHWIEQVRLSHTALRPMVFNSLVGAGIAITGVMKEEDVEWRGQYLEIGQPFVDVIDDSDYIGDVNARNRESFEMEGYYFRMPTEKAKDFYGGKVADMIKPTYKLHGDYSPDEVSKSQLTTQEKMSLRDHTEFMNIWLPDERVIITMLPGRWKILKTVEYDGPTNGPIHVLGYAYMPDNPMPVPPVWTNLDLDTAINVIINKIRSQAEREKSVLAYEDEAAEDVERITKTPDGGTVKVNALAKTQVVTYGGISKELMDWPAYLESQFSIQGGNLYTMGGRDVMAQTLGQEQMLQSNAFRMMDDMVNQTYEFVTEILKDVAWYRWTDPTIQEKVVKVMRDIAEVQALFDRTTRKGEFVDYVYKVEPYSMQRFNPQMKYQQLREFLQGWMLQVIQLAQQQGITVDVNAATRKLAAYIGLDVDDIWKMSIPITGQVGAPGVIPKPTAQGDDRFGATAISKLANLTQRETSPRRGSSSPPNTKAGQNAKEQTGA